MTRKCDLGNLVTAYMDQRGSRRNQGDVGRGPASDARRIDESHLHERTPLAVVQAVSRLEVAKCDAMSTTPHT